MLVVSKTPGAAVCATQISIFVGEANRVACDLLEVALNHVNDFRVVGSAVVSSEVTAGIVMANPYIALVTTTLEDGAMAGFRAVRDACLLRPRTRIIMLLDSGERQLVVDAFRVGAKGIFCRKDSLSALCRCITAVHSGQIWANSLELQYLLEAVSSAAPLRVANAKGEDLLTRREIDIVVLVAEGLSNRLISEKLQLSEHTVKNYLFHIFDKLGVSSRAELILYALAQREIRQKGHDSLLNCGVSGGGATRTLATTKNLSVLGP